MMEPTTLIGAAMARNHVNRTQKGPGSVMLTIGMKKNHIAAVAKMSPASPADFLSIMPPFIQSTPLVNSLSIATVLTPVAGVV